MSSSKIVRLVAVIAVVICSIAHPISATDYAGFLYDTSTDPTESTSIYVANKNIDAVASIKERVDYWATKVNGPEVASKTNKIDTWTAAGGVRPWITSDYEPLEVEQIYSNPDAPHIIFVLVDDWGYNDFGKRSTYLSWTTPNVDSLAAEGILLTNYYTHEMCTPSRGALLTGRYALRLGMMTQHEMAELPLHEVTLAQEMKSAGYRTYMVGKWHIGISTVQHWPTRRGFDSFYGYMNGDVDYWTKNYGDHLDLQDNEDLVKAADEIDSTYHNGYLLQKKAEEAIVDHATNYPNDPMFLYYSLQLIHAPWNAPDDFVARCESPTNKLTNKKIPQDDYVADVEVNYCGLNLMMDEVIANLTCALRANHMRDNTYLIISGDNGGEQTVPGNSYPYRGHKGSYWKGGVANTALIHSPLLEKTVRGRTYDGTMHITDWLPTLMHLATGGQWTGSLNGTETELDGLDQWESITTFSDSPRTETVFAVPADDSDYTAAIMIDNYRYYVASTGEPDLSTVDYIFTEDSGSSASVYSCDDISLVAAETRSASSFTASLINSLVATDESTKATVLPISFIIGMVVLGSLLLILFKCLEVYTRRSTYGSAIPIPYKAEEVPLYYQLAEEDELEKQGQK